MFVVCNQDCPHEPYARKIEEDHINGTPHLSQWLKNMRSFPIDLRRLIHADVTDVVARVHSTMAGVQTASQG